MLDAIAPGGAGEVDGRPPAAAPPTVRSSWSASGWPPRPARCRPRGHSPTPPAPGWPGCPRRAGERGALEAGALPDAAARRPSGRRRRRPGSTCRPRGRQRTSRPRPVATPPRILAAAAAGELGGLVVGGVDPADLPDPQAALAALAAARLRGVAWRSGTAPSPSGPTSCCRSRRRRRRAARSSTGRGGRARSRRSLSSSAISDYRALDLLADADGRPARAARPGRGPGRARPRSAPGTARAASPRVPAGEPPQPKPNEAVLATWRLLLDDGRLQDGEPYLAGTADPPGGPAVRRHRGRDRGDRGRRRRRIDRRPARSRCRSSSTSCPTGWSGCRPTPVLHRAREPAGRRRRGRRDLRASQELSTVRTPAEVRHEPLATLAAWPHRATRRSASPRTPGGRC